MSPKLASMGFTTAAEAAWFDQEVTAEQVGFLERPTSQRRLLVVFAAAFLIIGGVLGVARATVNPRRDAAALQQPGLDAQKSAPAAAVAPRAKKPVVARPAAAKPAALAKAQAAKKQAVHRGKAKSAKRASGRNVRGTRSTRHR